MSDTRRGWCTATGSLSLNDGEVNLHVGICFVFVPCLASPSPCVRAVHPRAALHIPAPVSHISSELDVKSELSQCSCFAVYASTRTLGINRLCTREGFNYRLMFVVHDQFIPNIGH